MRRQRDRPLTAAEIQALNFICRQHGVDLVELLRDQDLADRVEELTVRQVDQVVSLLKSSSQPPTEEEGPCPDGS